MKVLTLCVVERGDKILLGLKKRGFGMGKWNGFGGKVQPGETIEVAMARELKEEAGISPLDTRKRGVLTFEFEEEPDVLEVHVFSVQRFEGEVTESEEMLPQWFQKSDIPYEKMWADDKHWFPLLLTGKNFEGKFSFRGHDIITSQYLKEI